MSDEKLFDNRLRAEIGKLLAQTQTLNSETSLMRMNTMIAPVLAAAGVVGATAAIVRLLG